MYNEETDVLFPPRVIPLLRDLRGESWKMLVDLVSQKEGEDVERLAFVLLMVRIIGCSSCQADSYRAMRGCTQCALQTIRRFRGSDQDLLKSYKDAFNEVERYLENLSR